MKALRAQQKEHSERTLEGREAHTVRIDHDGDVVMDEWTKCAFCLKLKLLLMKANKIEKHRSCDSQYENMIIDHNV
jgi:hypothetical protein